MNQVLKKVLATLIVVSAASAAQAASFNFGYTFLSGQKIAGSFDGTVAADGNVVTGLSNINVFLDGLAFAGNGGLFGTSYDDAVGKWNSGGAVASFDGKLNNFMFSNVDYPAAGFTLNDNKFTVLSSNAPSHKPSADAWVKGVTTQDGGINVGDVYPGYYSPRGWEMSYARNVSAVPEPETYALMLSGLGCIGFVSRRRKLARAANPNTTPIAMVSH